MKISDKIYVWGDSIAKGIVMDEARGRYRISKENCLTRLEKESGVEIHNFAVMGNTSAQGLERMNAGMPNEGGVAVIEFGGNDAIWTGRQRANSLKSRSREKYR